MLLKSPNDLTDKINNNHFKKVNEYITYFIAPELVSYYIATGFNDSSIMENDYDIIIKSILEIINFDIELNNNIKNRISDILKFKYSLFITSETPLNLIKK